eukprot:3837455-Pleurochrysis_carterae.AAC.1
MVDSVCECSRSQQIVFKGTEAESTALVTLRLPGIRVRTGYKSSWSDCCHAREEHFRLGPIVRRVDDGGAFLGVVKLSDDRLEVLPAEATPPLWRDLVLLAQHPAR